MFNINKKRLFSKKIISVVTLLIFVAGTILLPSALEIETSRVANPYGDEASDAEESEPPEPDIISERDVPILGTSTTNYTADFGPDYEYSDDVSEYYNGANEFPDVYVNGELADGTTGSGKWIVEWSYYDDEKGRRVFDFEHPLEIRNIKYNGVLGHAGCDEYPDVVFSVVPCPFTTDHITVSMNGWEDQTEAPTKDNVILTYTSSGVEVDGDDYGFSYDEDNERIVLTDADGGHCDGNDPIYLNAPLKTAFNENNVDVSLDNWTDRTAAPTMADITVTTNKGVEAGSSDFSFSYDAGNERIVLTVVEGGCFQGTEPIYVSAPLKTAFTEENVDVSLKNWTDRTVEPTMADITVTTNKGVEAGSSDFSFSYDADNERIVLTVVEGGCFQGTEPIYVSAPLEKPYIPSYIPFNTDRLEVSIAAWTDRTRAPLKSEVAMTVKDTGETVDSSEYDAMYDTSDSTLTLRPAENSTMFNYSLGGSIVLYAPLEKKDPDNKGNNNVPENQTHEYVEFDTEHLDVSISAWTDRTREPKKSEVTLRVISTGKVVDSNEYYAVYDDSDSTLTLRPAENSTMFNYSAGGSIVLYAPLEEGTENSGNNNGNNNVPETPAHEYVAFDDAHISVVLDNWGDRTRAPQKNEIAVYVKSTGNLVAGSEYDMSYDDGAIILTPAPNSTVFDYDKGGRIEISAPLETDGGQEGQEKPEEQEKPEKPDSENSKNPGNAPVLTNPAADEQALNCKKVNASGNGYSAVVSMAESVPYTKSKQGVVSNLNVSLETKDPEGRDTGISIGKVKSTKPKKGSAKVTVTLKGSNKLEKKAVKKLNKMLKKILVAVGSE